MKPSRMKKVAWVLVVAWPILVAAAVMQYGASRRSAETSSAAAHLADTFLQLRQAVLQLELAELRAQIILQGPARVSNAPYETAKGATLEALRKLRPLADGTPVPAAGLSAFESAVSQEFKAFDQALSDHARGLPIAAKQKDTLTQALARTAQARETLSKSEKGLTAALAAERDGVSLSTHTALVLMEFGAGLSLWLVALAALLLFQDASRRQWAGVERRIHTRVLETLPAGVCLTDDAGVIVYTNPTEQALFDYGPDELLGRHVSFLDNRRATGQGTPEDPGEPIEAFRIWKAEFVGRKSSGKTFRCLVRGTRLEIVDRSYRIYLHEAAEAVP